MSEISARLEKLLPERCRLPLCCGLLCVVVGALELASLHLSRATANAALLWLPNAVVLVALVRAPIRFSPVLALSALLGYFASSTLYGFDLVFTMGGGFANLLEVMTGALLLRRFANLGAGVGLQTLLRTFALYVLVATPLGALVGGLLVRLHFGTPMGQVMMNWWLGDTIGFLLVGIPGLLATRQRQQPLPRSRSLADMLFTLSCLIGLSYLLLQYVPFPFIYIAATLAMVGYRDGALRISLYADLVLVVLGLLASKGYVDLAAIMPGASPRALWAACALTCVFPTLLGMAVEDLRQRQVEVQSLTERLRLASGAVRLGVWEWNVVNGDLVWDDNMFHLYDLDPARDMPLTFEQWQQWVHPEDRAQAEATVRAAMTGDGEFEMEYRICLPDGHVRHVQAAAVGVPDAATGALRMVGVNWDVSQSRQARLELARAQELLQGVINSASEFAIIATSVDGIITLFSVGAERMLGYSAGELVGKATPQCFHDPEEVRRRGIELSAASGRLIEGFDVFVASVRQGEAAESREWTYVRKDQSRVPVKLVVNAIRDSHGAITGFLGVAQDITEQKQAREALVATNQVLARARDAAEAANHAKSEFLANMSHEIRTPLHAVLGAAQLLEKQALTPRQQQLVDMIQSSGQSLLAILNDVLDFSKIEAERMELAHEPFDLDDVLGGIANMMSVNVGTKPIEPAIGVAPDLPRYYLGDALRLNQILSNLVGNAIKFTEQGEVVLGVKMLEQAGGRCRLQFSVRDTGIGMDKVQQTRVFTAFSQVDTSITRRFGGTGLGLVICKRLIELMQGEIEMESEAGVGTEFRFTVALGLAPEQPQPVNAGRRHLLVVDANPTSRDILSDLFRSWGWEAQVVADVAAAQHCLEQTGSQGFDGILVDWKIAERDQLTATLAEQAPELQRVLLVSVYGRERMQDNEHWDVVLVKPLMASGLLDALRWQNGVDANTAVEPVYPLQGVRILLVEDNETNQAVACGLLEEVGADVDVVSDGSQAVVQLRLAPDRYQLVLMDVQMPVMDGFTATDIIRRELKLTMPIIAMSAGVKLEEQAQCLASGMDGFIAKPVDFERMLKILQQHLQVGASSHSSYSMAPVSTPGNNLFAPDKLLAIVRGKPQRLRDILDMIDRFIARGLSPLEDGRRLLAQDNTVEAARLFHTLKGSMGNLGAEQMWAAADVLEEAIRSGDKVAWPLLLQQMESSFQATLAAARNWREAHPEFWEEAAEEAASVDLDQKALEQFRHHLQEQNLQACDDFQDLQASLQTQLTPQKMKELQTAIQALDFPEALRVMEGFILSPPA